MIVLKLPSIAVAAWLLAACASSPFDASWTAADATPLRIEGAKVAAIAMMESESERRAAEDALARELDARGAEGAAMYAILPDASLESEAEVRAALDGMGFAGAVVIRPVARSTELIAEPVVLSPDYLLFWNGYYGFGWRDPWRVTPAGAVRTRSRVSVEVLVYSLRQNKLVWGGRTTTAESGGVARLVKTAARRAAKELERQGLLSHVQARSVP